MAVSSAPLATAFVSVMPDRPGFDKAMTSLLNKARRDRERLQSAFKSLRVGVEISATAKTALAAFKARARAPVTFQVRAELNPASVARVRRFRDWARTPVTMQVRVEVPGSSIARIQRLRAFISRAANIRVGVDISTAIRGRIDRIKTSIRRPVHVRLDLDARRVLARWASIRSRLMAPIRIGLIARAGASAASIATGFTKASRAKDAFAANVDAKMPRIRAQLRATARAASMLGSVWPSTGSIRIPRRIGGLGGGLGLGGAIGGGVGVYAMAGQFKKTSDVAGTFENKMLQVRGVLELLGPQGEKTFNMLRRAAMSLSANSLGFGPIKVAETFQELAEKGWNVNQILSSTPHLMDLAAVSNVDLAKTSEIVAAALNAFQMDASKAGEVADILQSSANKSSSDILYMGEALRHSSGFAHLMGMDLSELSSILGAMSQSGMTAADAGYAVSTMFQRLINPTTRGTKSLKAIKDIFAVTGKDMNQFFQGNTIRKGKIMDFLGVVDEYRKKVTPERFGQNFSRIVGAKGGKLLQMFAYKNMQSGKTGFEEVGGLTKEIRDDIREPGKKGIVQKQRETVEQGFEKNVDKLVAAVERLRVSVGTVINEELIKLVQWLTQGVDWLTKFNEQHDGLIAHLAMATAATVAFVAAGLGIGAVALLLGSLLGPVLLVGAAIGALTFAWLQYKDDIIVGIEEAILKLQEMRLNGLLAARDVATAMDKMLDKPRNAIARMIIENNPLLSDEEKRQQLQTLTEDQERARKRPATSMFDGQINSAKEAVGLQKKNVSLAMVERERKKKERAEKALIKDGEGGGKAGVPPSQNDHGDLEAEEDQGAGKKKKRRGHKDRDADIVGLEEIHNKIQAGLMKGDEDKFQEETADNTEAAVGLLESIEDKLAKTAEDAKSASPQSPAGKAAEAAAPAAAEAAAPVVAAAAVEAVAPAADLGLEHGPVKIGKPDPELMARQKPEDFPHLQAALELYRDEQQQKFAGNFPSGGRRASDYMSGHGFDMIAREKGDWQSIVGNERLRNGDSEKELDTKKPGWLARFKASGSPFGIMPGGSRITQDGKMEGPSAYGTEEEQAYLQRLAKQLGVKSLGSLKEAKDLIQSRVLQNKVNRMSDEQLAELNARREKNGADALTRTQAFEMKPNALQKSLALRDERNEDQLSAMSHQKNLADYGRALAADETMTPQQKRIAFIKAGVRERKAYFDERKERIAARKNGGGVDIAGGAGGVGGQAAQVVNNVGQRNAEKELSNLVALQQEGNAIGNKIVKAVEKIQTGYE